MPNLRTIRFEDILILANAPSNEEIIENYMLGHKYDQSLIELRNFHSDIPTGWFMATFRSAAQFNPPVADIPLEGTFGSKYLIYCKYSHDEASNTYSIDRRFTKVIAPNPPFSGEATELNFIEL